MSNPIPPNYSQLLGDIKQRIRSSQYEALKAVNKELIGLYWDIGRIICDRQQTAGWGKSVVEQLAKDIQTEFPGISGFSVRNVWNMRSFYSSYSQNEKLQPLVAEIGWTHNLIIYALRESNKPIGIATYQMVSTIPQSLKDQLPAPEQVAKLRTGLKLI